MSETYHFTPNAQRAIKKAEEEATRFNHAYIGTEHILLGILAVPDCAACVRFQILGVRLDDLILSTEQQVGFSGDMRARGNLPLTPRTKKILHMATIEAKMEDRVPAGTVHIIQAILREGEGVAAQVLTARNITLEKFSDDSLCGKHETTNRVVPDGQSNDGPIDSEAEYNISDSARRSPRGENKKAVKTPALNMFGRDLTQAAARGELDPVVGRQRELERVIQVLSRRSKNNAVLIGEAGVGKTAVVEGLAQAIALGDVPERMRGKRIIALDMARMVAGTQYRGQFEERIKHVLEEATQAKNIVLFLDELHTIIGAGGAEGAMDAANIIKPALARGELQCVGATTLNEYRKSIEKDAALERRFQSIIVNEPTIDEALEILKGIAPRYEEHHNVTFAPDALEAAVRLTARYLPSRLLPDKAIDAIDETGARVRMRAAIRPPDVRADEAAIETMRQEKEKAIAAQQFEEAANFRDRELAARKELEKMIDTWRKEHAEKSIAVTADDVTETVASISGVPIRRMSQTESARLLDMEKELNAIVIGQTPAISAISRALRRSRADLKDPNRPIGSFVFLGPTGVGKSMLAKVLAEKVFGDTKALIQLDMSEYMEKFSVSRLVGSPPGYVGHEDGGQLTEQVRRRPYSVVLFDEVEKAHPEVMNMLLQILEDGHLTDSQGRRIDFRNTIVILTSNLGSGNGGKNIGLGFGRATITTEDYDKLRERIITAAKQVFKPELLNRFDDLIVFRTLSKEDVVRILDIEIGKLRQRLSAKDITIEFSDDAMTFLVGKGYDDTLGARPLRRAVERFVEDPLAESLLRGDITTGKLRATCAADGTALVFTRARATRKSSTAKHTQD